MYGRTAVGIRDLEYNHGNGEETEGQGDVILQKSVNNTMDVEENKPGTQRNGGQL